MILFRHTRWKKHKTAWVWFHHSAYTDYAFSKKRRWGPVIMKAGKKLYKVKWDEGKPYVVWSHGIDPGKRYLAPEGRIAAGYESTWSCAYPERPLWYPAVNPFKEEEIAPPPVVVGHIHLGNLMQVFQVQANDAQNNFIPYEWPVGDGVALQVIAHPVGEPVIDFEDAEEIYLDDDPDQDEEEF